MLLESKGFSRLRVQISTAVMFGIASLCFIGRIVIRLMAHKRLFFDDCLLIVAFGSLCGATAVLYKNLFLFFMMNAIFEAPQVTRTTAILPYIQMLLNNAPRRNTFSVLQWTAVFMVKFSFFAFFRQLVWSFRRLYMYYWFCVGFTVLAYGVSISEDFIMTRYTSSPVDGLKFTWYTPILGFTIAICMVDIITDMMSKSAFCLRRTRESSLTHFPQLSAFRSSCCENP